MLIVVLLRETKKKLEMESKDIFLEPQAGKGKNKENRTTTVEVKFIALLGRIYEYREGAVPTQKSNEPSKLTVKRLRMHLR